MTIQEIVTNIISQAPMVALLLYQLNILYVDWKADRSKASDERMLMMDRIERLNERLDVIVEAILNEKKQ